MIKIIQQFYNYLIKLNGINLVYEGSYYNIVIVQLILFFGLLRPNQLPIGTEGDVIIKQKVRIIDNTKILTLLKYQN